MPLVCSMTWKIPGYGVLHHHLCGNHHFVEIITAKFSKTSSAVVDKNTMELESTTVGIELYKQFKRDKNLHGGLFI